MTVLLYQFIPTIAALVLAVGFLTRRRRTLAALPMRVRLLTGIGMGLALGLMATYTAWSVYPWWPPPLSEDGMQLLTMARFAIPLVLCILALAFLLVPAPLSSPGGTAALAPRTPMTFTSRRWLATTAGVAAGAVLVAVLAGLASSPDEAGRYTSYVLRLNANTSAGASIYGWWFSIPCLVLVAVIAALVLAGLIAISRPALAADSQADAAVRTARIRNILAVSTGGLLLHLAAVLQSLHSSSSLRTTHAGYFEVGTSFASMGPALQLGAVIAFVLGMAMWWFTLFSVLPAKAPKTSRAVAA